MKKIISLPLLFLLCVPCFAASDAVLYKQETWVANLRTNHPHVVGATFNGNSCTKIDFSGASAEEIESANLMKAEYPNYEPPPKPNYEAFKNMILDSQVIPAEAIDQLALYFPLLEYVEQGKTTVPKMQARWASVKQALGPELSAVVEAYAAATNVPLVP